MNWQIKPTAMIWGKVGYMKNTGSGNNFYLGFDNPSVGDTRVILTTFGTTWTLGPSTVLDGNFGMSRQDQTVLPADYGTNYGLQLGIPGTNNPSDLRESGLPVMASTYTLNSGSANWMPLWRKEISYSGTLALTKVFAKHEMRTGMDFVRLELNHDQAEWGDYGLKGGFSFSNNTTGAVGYTSPGWNSFAAMLMGLPNYYAEDTQTETMTGRENQFAFYIRDRWTVSPKLTVSAGARLDYYPLMSRVGRGIETLDYNTYVVTLGGIGGQPKDAGVNIAEVVPGAAPRCGVPLQREHRVQGRLRRHEEPAALVAPDARVVPVRHQQQRHGGRHVRLRDHAGGRHPGGQPARHVDGHRSSCPGASTSARQTSERGVRARHAVQQWNVSFERRLPQDIAVEVAYVGTATDGGYADLNHNVGVPGGGGTAAKYYASAGTTAINDWGSRTKSRYKGLQIALNRPFKNGLMLKGAYTWSQAKNMADEDGWTALTWNYLPKYDDNFAIAGFDRTHMFRWAGSTSCRSSRTARTPWARSSAAGRSTACAAWFTGTPYSIGGTNNAMACQGCGSILINYNGDPKAIGEAGNIPAAGTTDFSSYTYYDKSHFSQPSGLDVAGFGNTERNFFRRPAQWNVDFSHLQGVPDRALPSGVPARDRQPLQHQELGRAEHDVHVAATS